MDAYAVLVFHDQRLTDEQQIAFTLNFGELESYKTPGHIRKGEDQRLGPGIADFSNLDPTARSCRLRIASGSSSWATGSGTPTAPSARRRPSTRCSRGASSRRGAPTPS